jgi:hypothetical protein
MDVFVLSPRSFPESFNGTPLNEFLAGFGLGCRQMSLQGIRGAA